MGGKHHEENSAPDVVSSGAASSHGEPFWSQVLSYMLEGLREVGRVVATFIMITGFIVSVGATIICLLPKQVGFCLLFLASICLPVEELMTGLQVRCKHVFNTFYVTFLPIVYLKSVVKSFCC